MSDPTKGFGRQDVKENDKMRQLREFLNSWLASLFKNNSSCLPELLVKTINFCGLSFILSRTLYIFIGYYVKL